MLQLGNDVKSNGLKMASTRLLNIILMAPVSPQLLTTSCRIVSSNRNNHVRF